jgi:hypothetical protein
MPSGDNALVDGRGVAAAVVGAVCDFGPFPGSGNNDFRLLGLRGSQLKARLERSRADQSSFPGGTDGLLRPSDSTLWLSALGEGRSSDALRLGGLSMSIDLL